MSKIIETNSENFQKDVLEHQGLVLVDFWAPWCGPCRQQSPILEKIAGDSDLKALIVKLNTDESPEIAQKSGIDSIPTLILYKNGQEIERLIGVQPEAVLKKKLQQ